MATIEEIDRQYAQLALWRDAWGNDPAAGRNYDAQMQALVAQRNALAAQQAANNDAWHREHGTGDYAMSGAGGADDMMQRSRQSAFDYMKSVLADYGIDPDGTGLSAKIKDWIWQDKPVEWVKVELRKTDAYNKRFPGMAELIKRGQFMDEATYIAQEREYRNVLSGWGLPKGFYDDPTDFGKFIGGGVSVKEVDDRVRSAKTFLDNQNPAYRQALTELYGVREGEMLAYVLDSERAQSVIARQMKQAALSGAAESKGRFDLSAEESARYAGSLGQQYDTIGQDQIGALEESFAKLGEQADQDARLAYIDKEQYSRTDALDAALLSDSSKTLASQRRAAREQSRFSGSSSTNAATFARRGGA